ncbi:filamentous hemagglutinin N-terminal domain-containing protein [Candidatus Methylopumilus universalis]|uniref:autotransporter-associated beta strand repeat-containing protein n=1 Tax=Candidatus Methylopumilus universalis TaxID=2588536 RepID=UPI00111E7866|nr:autotransporter-associated beta strand repeat-containing protein [Candidatus Methylopumilus universalis]QDC95766.1 filamentous hemagglutinin N-terminal domain-containing protein [Candidatus Methylopumilus universalis]
MKKALQKLKLVFFFALSLLSSLVDVAYAEPAVNALPTGGQVISGDASIATSGATLNVNQTSQRAIVNWDSFNVGKDATVNFNQPNSSASTLNRISSGTPSQIYGKINAVGEVILQNTAGVYFSKSASLDVGSIAATTHTISNDDFNNGKYHFDRNGSTGSVINEGHIKAGLNGYVAMLAPEVRNSGLIVAQMGTVVMAAGERVTLNFDTTSHLASITTTPATINTLIENKSAVTVNGGTIILSAKAMNTLVSGVIKQSGTLDASNVVNKVVSVGGRIMIDGDNINIAANSETLAHGSVAGGSVAISASRVLTTEAQSKINVSAIESGNGGVIKTSAPSTSLAGEMTALGGLSSGKGGVIETNADTLSLANTSTVNANNQDGLSDKGTWTINLPNLTMTSSIAEVISNTLNTTNVKLNLLASSFDLLKDQVIEKIDGTKSFFEINTKTQMSIAGNISSHASAPLDLILSSYESILVSSSSTINVRNIDAEAPTISVAGNLNAYGNSNQDSSPFLALIGARLAITGNLRSGSKQNSGRILLKGSNEVNISSSGNIVTAGNNGGVVEILSSHGAVTLAGAIMTNGESGRGGTININASQNILMSNANLLANGTTDGGLIIVASNNADVNFQQSFIQTNGGAGVGGTILLSGVNNTLISSTEISARGYIQGGSIKVGNDLANQLIPFSRYTEIDLNSVLNASQINSNIQNNQGGLIETSASTVNLLGSINAGRGGMWLLDPFNITIDSTKASYIKTVLDAGSSVTISTASASNTVGLNSISGSSGLGNITIDAAISSSGAGASLTLIAANDIYVNQAITLSGARSSVTFTANNTNLTSNITTYGNQTFNSNIRLYSGITLTSNGGDVNITGNVIGISGLIEFLGGGIYKYNGTSYTVGVGSSPINVLYNSSTSTYSWQAQSTSAEVLLVAGGGGGGMDIGGGGGGGGVISTTVVTASQTWYEIKVGAGGSGAPAGCSGAQACDHNFTINATAGGNSTMQNAGATIIAIGGGYGGTSYWTSPLGGQGGSGGSGGGAAGYNAGTSGKNGSGTAGQGFAGASGYNSHVSGGGGGAGAPGNTGGSNGASSGGAGIENCILGTCYYWGGGGGGSGHSYTGGNGGIGGGGGGAVGTTTGGTGYNNGSAGGAGCTNCQAQSPGGNGGANTGGGGGGGSHYNRTNQGGNGGSGIAVLKYNGSLIINSGAGSVALGGTVADGALTINSNSISNSIAGAISGAMSLTKLGTGSLTLNGTGSSYTGATTISAGAIKLGAADVISNSSAVNLAGSLDLNGFSEAIGSLSGAGTITSSGSGTLTITIGADNSSTSFSGVIEKGSATSLALTKSGSGTLTLSGSNTYDGGTNINAGVLSLGSTNAIGTSGTISFGGGTLQYTSSNTTDYSSRLSGASGQAFKVDTNGRNVTWATNLTNASSSITKSGAGTLTLGVINLANATFNQGTVVATSISISGTSSIGGTITTSGVVSFAGASTLVRDTTITSSNNNVTFVSTIDGEFELVINAGSGVATLGGAIGGTAAVARLEVSASGGINVGSNIRTVMGLIDGLYFEKFVGQAYGNMTFYNTATRRNINDGHGVTMPTSASNPVTTINAANGTVAVTTGTSTSIYVCPGTDCDSNYSVRATGYFIAPTTGTYTFATYADDDHYLFMGTANESISDFITRVQSSSATPNVGERGLVVRAPGCCATITGTVALVGGNRYPIFATYNEGGGGDYMWTKFMLPGQSSYVAGVRGEVSNGLGYYYSNPNGASGGGGTTGVALTGPVTLLGNSRITSANAAVTITGAISSDSTPRSLTVDAQTFNAQALTSLSGLSVTVADTSAITGIISGDMNFTKAGDGLLTLSRANTFNGSTTVSAGTLRLSGSGSSLGMSTNTLTLSGGSLDLVNKALSLHTLTMNNSNSSIISSSGTSSLNILNASSLRGSITTRGTQTYSDAVTLTGNMTFASINSDITFSSTISGAYNLTIDSGTGYARFNGALSNINNFSSLGATILDRSISTTGTQSYGATSLNASVSLTTTNDDITFNSTLKGAYGLTANVGTARISFFEPVGDDNLTDALSVLTVNGIAYFADNVYTARDQTYSTDIMIAGNVNLKSLNGNVSLGGNVNAIGSARITFLGGGYYRYESGFTSELILATALTSLSGVSWNSSVGKYSWIAASGSTEALIVGGGGGGGSDMGGGGGGGGVISSNAVAVIKLNSYDIFVGQGGSGAPAGQGRVAGSNGTNSSFAGLIAIGGGGGASNHDGSTNPAGNGGSGGGASGGAQSPNGGSGGGGGYGGGRAGVGTVGQGNNGSFGIWAWYPGGGGGAGGAGSTNPANGGVGIANGILDTTYYWGGGGGGSGYSGAGGNGGIGGGGGGAVGTTTGGAGYNNGSGGGGGCTNCWAQTPGGNAGANTGGGGGGGSHYNSNNQGGNGGSGIVVLKYTTNNNLTLTANNGTITLPSDLTLSNLASITMTDKNTNRDLTFNSLSLVNTTLDLANRKLTVASLNMDVNSAITNSSGTAKLYVTGASSIAGSITTGGDYFEVTNALTVKDVKTQLDETLQTSWGQFYGGAVTLIGNATLNSNNFDIGFNSTIKGSHDLTVNAGFGYVMFKGKVGFDPLLETTNTEVLLLNRSQGNDYVAYGNRNYSTSTSFARSSIRTTDNPKNLTVTGNEIFIKADVTTEYNQTYRGHVNIGNNGTNGTTRSLISLDPTISFYGRALPYTKDDGKPGETIYKYTFDDESSAPTHTLILVAKGYCYVGAGAPACGESGNIRMALDIDGLSKTDVLYNSWKPLLKLITDNETMRFPGSGYNYQNINLNNLTLPASSRGVTDGSRNTTESTTVTNKEVVNYQYSLRPRSSPVISNTSGTPPGARGFVAGSVGRVASSSDTKSITAFIPVKNNLSGDVVIGNVSASFIDNGSSTSNTSTNKSTDCKTQAKAECK